jgi:hypothetical protein
MVKILFPIIICYPKKCRFIVATTIEGYPTPWTLEFAYVLNVGTIHDGAPFFDLSIFAPLHAFLAFFLQNWNL